jgi:hypothetical protein
MTSFRKINSPVALATCGMFLVPEPFGACLLLAAAIWWLWRKTGCPCRSMLSSFREAVRRGLHYLACYHPDQAMNASPDDNSGDEAVQEPRKINSGLAA